MLINTIQLNFLLPLSDRHWSNKIQLSNVLGRVCNWCMSVLHSCCEIVASQHVIDVF